MTAPLTIAFISIARPTFDVPLAQSVAEAACAQLEQAGYQLLGTGSELLMDEAGARRTIQSLTQSDFDLLILMQASFADSSMAVRVAQSVQSRRLPTLLWAVPEERDGGRLRLNSLCGINLAGHAFRQHDLLYDYLLLPPHDPQAQTKVATLARAGRGVRTLQRANIGLVGEHPAGFETCEYDGVELGQLLGSRVTPFSLTEMLERARTATDPQRDAFLTQVGRHAANLGDLDQTALRGTAGVYATLRTMAEEEALDGVAVRCWPEFFTELGCAACGAMSMLTEEGTPCSCEADVNGTLTLVLLQALSGSQPFITDLVSVDAESDTGVLWHCGLAPVSMADPQTTIQATVHSNRKLPLLFEFPLKPGRITIARLHRRPNGQGGHGYHLVIGGGEVVRSPKSFGGTSGVVRFDRSAIEVFETVMTEGLEHHFCIVYGEWRAELAAFARLVDLPILNLT